MAAVATTLLVVAMSRLIATDFSEPPAEEYSPIKSVHMPEMKVTTIREEPPQPPQPVPSQPTFDPPAVDPTIPKIPTVMAPPTVSNEANQIVVSRDPVPVFKPSPRYPSAALRKGIEGYVVVEFTITKTGSVKDVRVVAGYDSAGNPTNVFNRSAIAAAARFKYQPQLRDGVPVEQYGVRNRIRYKLGD
ncbi:energy transducer TonB [Microbulbifer thermotolerans]|nr:energy transducer TonB [Microbulbifer thermotolerans]MCX2782206.1 energy transducer TonB [Microbulbifer thermotolerans]